jgi:SAM-dependent MidA family methyltransferase
MKLPTPSHVERLHSNKLTEIIQEEIQQSNGLINFARFMELALYAPGLGYYSAGQLKFGKKGDFVTAPEITDLFAQCIALQCNQILTELKNGDILEIGAGSGMLAKDLLIALEKLNSLPEHYFILEISAELRERQQNLLSQNLPHLFSRIIWLNELPAIPFNGIIIANEVMDAMPVHRFTLDRIENKTIIKEQYVTWQKDYFTWQPAPPTRELAELLTFIS